MTIIWVGSYANYNRLKGLMDLFNKKGYPYGVITGTVNIPDEYPVVYRIDNLMFNDTPQNMVNAVSIIIQQFAGYLANNHVSRIIIHGDRFENSAPAIAAAYCNIPICHTEGGEVTGCIDDKVRNAISMLADIHFVTSDQSLSRLSKMGRRHVYNVGSLALDQVVEFKKTINVAPRDSYVVVLYHPVTNRYESPVPLISAIKDIAQRHHVLWIGPNVDPGHKKIIEMIKRTPNVEVLKPLESTAYLELLYGCSCLVGNTSSGIKEGGYLGIPYIMYGSRQATREVDKNVVRVTTKEQIIMEVEKYTGAFSPIRLKYSGRWGYGDSAKNIMTILEDMEEWTI